MRISQRNRISKHCAVYVDLIYAAVWLYITHDIFRSLRDQRVPHRLYLLEKNRKFEPATRRNQPLEYWLSIIIQFLLWTLVAWAGIHRAIVGSSRI
jgi:hypothetical protein